MLTNIEVAAFHVQYNPPCTQETINKRQMTQDGVEVMWWHDLVFCLAGFWEFLSLLYRSLRRERPWVEHLTSVAAFNKKEHPCHVYSDSMSSKQIIGQSVTYNGATSEIKAS